MSGSQSLHKKDEGEGRDERRDERREGGGMRGGRGEG